ncbi:hypothetical protein FZC83_07790 [Rossellomorea marisflavi]|uniref:Uncharacterized protein n=1 Tax=Rossellomorea marisflavi TaxID=189381 RepID=A0A0M0G569_9BACI|nr:hypothetical protein [Rossellomorea marisflavi]KON84933.1 hypothetical protein AF331_13105 [Rossellomorea marisflavi]TYS54841.1 hypothetical protein FZC83_07790 [Rossellomorea marisflavi]
MNTSSIIKTLFVKQIRTTSFAFITLICLLVCFICVPANNAGYEVFYIGGVRGIYNSAWLGGMLAMLSTLLVWLFGFYKLRSQVTEDYTLGVSSLIATSPISDQKYMFMKVISNYLVLLLIQSILTGGFIVMQVVRGEEHSIHLLHYLLPFLLVCVPSYLVLASLSVLFDVCPGLKGSLGNILFFGLWLFLSVVTIALPSSFLDVFGIDIIRESMVNGAQTAFQNIGNHAEGGSFGYYPLTQPSSTFEWGGVNWNARYVLLRGLWIVIAIGLTFLAGLLFHRFRHSSQNSSPSKKRTKEKTPVFKRDIGLESLTPIHHARFSFINILMADARLLLKGVSKWRWFLLFVIFTSTLFLQPDTFKNAYSFVLLVPIGLWACLGNREREIGVHTLILSSRSPIQKLLSTWISCSFLTFIFFSGIILRLYLNQDSDWISWVISAGFLPALGLMLGTLTHSRKLFDVLYLLWWYLGPFNDVANLNFISFKTSFLFAIMTCLLVLATLGVPWFLKYSSRLKLFKGRR